MTPSKLYTRQYTPAELRRPNRRKIRGKHILRTGAVLAAVGIAECCGSGIAQANNHQQEACALMDDSATAISLGYGNSTLQYAYAVLSTEMPQADAAHLLFDATHSSCPNHAADLPAGWR